LQLGRAQLLKTKSDFRVNRLLLLSDGQPTVGLTSQAALSNIIVQMKSEGLSTTALGVGADFNERLMQNFADVGGGSYGFAGSGDGQALLTTFEKDLSQAGTLVARSVSIWFPLENGMINPEVYGRPVARQAGDSGQELIISMPDFSAGQTERVVIHFTKNTSNLGVELMGQYSLDYEDVLAEKHASAAVSLSAVVVADREVVKSKLDKQAYVFGKEAQAKKNYDFAADALSNGDTTTAQAALHDNDILFDDAANVAGEMAVSGPRAENKAAYGLTAKPATNMDERREQGKVLNRQGMKSSGRGDSVY